LIAGRIATEAEKHLYKDLLVSFPALIGYMKTNKEWKGYLTQVVQGILMKGAMKRIRENSGNKELTPADTIDTIMSIFANHYKKPSLAKKVAKAQQKKERALARMESANKIANPETRKKAQQKAAEKIAEAEALRRKAFGPIAKEMFDLIGSEV